MEKKEKKRQGRSNEAVSKVTHDGGGRLEKREQPEVEGASANRGGTDPEVQRWREGERSRGGGVGVRNVCVCIYACVRMCVSVIYACVRICV